MTRFFSIIFICSFLCFACKKENITNNSSNNGNGVTTPYVFTTFSQKTGDTCYYHKDEIETSGYNTTPTITPVTITKSCDFFTTIIKDSVLSNGVIGKVYSSNESGLGVITNQLIYYDSILSGYVVKFYNGSFNYPLLIKTPLVQNTSWLNTVNLVADTCKAYSSVFCAYKNSYNYAIDLKHYFVDNNGRYNGFEYYVGDKGFYKMYREYGYMTGGNYITLTQTITLTKTNF